MNHRLSSKAAEELDDIWHNLATESNSFDVADRFIDSLTDHFFMLAKHPLIGRTREELRPGYRGFPVGQYLILYRVLDTGVEIMHVLHGRRDLDGFFR